MKNLIKLFFVIVIMLVSISSKAQNYKYQQDPFDSEKIKYS